MSYILYGPDPSGFTRKLEAALRFYDAPFERVRAIGDEREALQHRAGTHQLPVLQTPENWLLSDSTPIMQMLDGRYPTRALFSAGTLGFLVHLLEEVLDEWVSRVYVHYRWHYPRNASYALERLGDDILADADKMLDWGRRSCRATGTELPSQQQFAEQEYLAILTAAEAQLQHTAYLLGDRPCAVDAALLGGLRAHTHHDPIPDLSGFPNVVLYAEGAGDAWDGSGELAPFPESTHFAQHLLKLAEDHYGRFVEANRLARRAQHKAFEIAVYGEPVSYMARAYPEASRLMLLARFNHQLTPPQQATIRRWLESHCLSSLLV